MKTISSKVSELEHEVILEYASCCGLTVSDLIRRALMNEILFVDGGYFDEAPHYELKPRIPENAGEDEFATFTNKFRKKFGLRSL